MGTMAKRQLSKKEIEEQKKKDDEEAAAHVSLEKLIPYIKLQEYIQITFITDRSSKSLWKHFKRCLRHPPKFGLRLALMMLVLEVSLMGIFRENCH